MTKPWPPKARAGACNRLLNGDNKIKVWRKHSGLTQSALAESCNMTQASIAQMESGKRTGTIAALKK